MTKDQNYYKQLYKKFIDSRRDLIRDGYIERHHIKPRGLGGNNDPSNLIDLTPREHFFAHLLLYKIYPTNLRVIHGLNAMACGGKKQLNSWQYGFIKSAVTKKRPPKSDLLNLYYDKNFSYKKIGALYHVSDMTVCKWFKMYNINTGRMKKGNNKYKYTYDELVVTSLYKRGGVKAIQTHYGVSLSMASEWAKKCNLLPVKTIGIVKLIPPKEELYNVYVQNNTIKDIAKMFGVSMSLMQKWIKQYNFEPRPRLKSTRSLKSS